MGAGIKVAGAGLCEERPGAASCWTKPAPVASPQGSAEPLSHSAGVSGKNYLRKGRKGWGERGGGNKRVKNNRGNTKVRGRGGGAPRHSSSPWRTRVGAGGYSSSGKCGPWRGPTLEQVKSVSRKVKGGEKEEGAAEGAVRD